MESLRLRGPPRPPLPSHHQDTETIKQNLLKNGVTPTPKIIHTLRKKQLQKSNRRRPTPADQSPQQEQQQEEEAQFQSLKDEFKTFNMAIVKATKSKQEKDKDRTAASSLLVGKPWERLERAELMEYASANKESVGGENLKYEHLYELSEFIEKERDKFKWILEDDIELDGLLENKSDKWVPPKRKVNEGEAIRFLVDRLSGTELSMKNWKFSRMMKQSQLQFTEDQLLKIVGGLGEKGQWQHALSVVKLVYSSKEHKHFKSRFVYTKLLSVLGKARRPHEALQIFNLMRADYHIYPDMAAYHCIAIALGQSGLLKELVNVIDSMKQHPSKIKKRKNWDPVLQPDLVVYNAVLNACTLSGDWKGVSWVFEELRRSGLKPSGATYGLAMEVMMASGKYELVHEYFEKMKRSGNAPKALTYKVLVKAFSKEGKVNEAVEVVRDMESKGVVGAASVYCELAFCLCYNGMWQEAILEIKKMKKLPLTRPLVVTFTGMILSSMDGGHIGNCMRISDVSKEHCAPDIGIVNAMLKVYGRNDMFLEAKELFEDTKRSNGHNISVGRDGPFVSPDAYTYGEMLRASASAHQWEYFDYVYKEMVFSGYQLDQNKHAFLLVEASRAGKTHLLEHAFDVMLEAGEIPPSSFFVEIICRAMIQDDFDRALTILNSMAHAPFQVKEKEWRGLFEEYKGKITRSHLRKLFDEIGTHDIAMEASAYKLSRLLQSLCGSKSKKSYQVSSGTQEPDLVSLSDDNNRPKLDSIMERFADELTIDESVEKFRDEKSMLTSNEGLDDDYDSEDDFLAGELGELDESKRNKLPSADGILENWKESMIKDGIFLPFQIGKK